VNTQWWTLGNGSSRCGPCVYWDRGESLSRGGRIDCRVRRSVRGFGANRAAPDGKQRKQNQATKRRTDRHARYLTADGRTPVSLSTFRRCSAPRHRSSYRAERPLIKVNCAAIPCEPFDGEFFGHSKFWRNTFSSRFLNDSVGPLKPTALASRMRKTTRRQPNPTAESVGTWRKVEEAPSSARQTGSVGSSVTCVRSETKSVERLAMFSASKRSVLYSKLPYSSRPRSQNCNSRSQVAKLL